MKFYFEIRKFTAPFARILIVRRHFRFLVIALFHLMYFQFNGTDFYWFSIMICTLYILTYCRWIHGR